MKRAISLCAAALCIAAFAEQSPKSEVQSPKSLKVLMIGNSFSICVQQEMPKIAKSMGLKLDLASLYIGGCSLERHWQNVTAATNAAFKPYKYTRYVDGAKTIDATANVPDALVSEKWDVVTLQQASHFSWRGETYNPFASKLIATIRKHAPQAEVVVQETWSYTPWDKRLAKWGIGQHEMYSRLHRAYYDFASSCGLRVIPMGTAVQLFRAQLPVVYADNSFGGDVCGSAKFEQTDGKWTPKGDVFHLNSSGCYLQGLVWTAKLFGADVTRCGYAPKKIAPETAALMKKCAMEAVRGKQPPKSHGGAETPKKVADGMERIRNAGVDGGELAEVEYRSGSLRVGYVLRPTPVSFIRCELNLPDPEKWSGRFYGHGNGGWAGGVSCVRDAANVRVDTDLGTSHWRIDDNPVPIEIVRDFGWRATHLMTVSAKRLAQIYYGRAPTRCYFRGASTGGGQAMCEAQRFPDDYDGIVAEVPALDRLTRAAGPWRIEQLKKRFGKWFTPAEQKQIRAAELAFFAHSDPAWARGKFIVDPRPTPAKLDGCWREIVKRNPALADREQLWRALFEPIAVRGRALCPGMILGAEFAPQFTFTLGKIVGPRTAATTTEDDLVVCADEPDMRFVNPDLSAFRARGGKMIMYAGLEDIAVPALPICEYYDSVLAKMEGAEATQTFFRFFLEPGRPHAPHGPQAGAMGAPKLDGAIEAWVEKGVAPNRLTFEWNDASGRELTVLPYPDNAAVCDAPKRPLVVGLADRCYGGAVVGFTNKFAVCAYNYAKSVSAAGGVPVVLPFTTNAAEIARSLTALDALVLCGGEDVAPARYGETPSPKCGAPNLRRDAYEFALLDEAVKRRLPVVGTCRGQQLINVYFGGTLVQDVPSEVPNAVTHRGYAHHPISIAPGSRVSAMFGGATNAVVNTWHHQAVEKVAPGFRATAWAPDGVVEAIEHESLPIASVQFHPEVSFADHGDKASLAFFTRLLEWAGAE